MAELPAIPDEAVELAARADHQQGRLAGEPTWDELSAADQDGYRDAARTILGAALAPLAEQVVRAVAGCGAGGSHHYYLSTACLHGQCGYCVAPTVTRDGQWEVLGPSYTTERDVPKNPAACKFCGAPCIGRCHRPTLP